MKRKFLSALLLLMIVAVHSVFAEEFVVDGLKYEPISNTQVVVTGPAMSRSTFTIPATVSYGGKTYEVWGIFEIAFRYYPDLFDITISHSPCTIYKNAFEGSSLRSITFADPSKGISIEDEAFMGCNALQGLTLPDNTLYVGHNIIKNCANIQDLYIYNVEEMLADALTNSSVTRVLWSCPKMPKSFNGFNNSTTPNVSSFYAIADVPDNLCKDMTSLTDVWLVTGGITRVGNYAFKNCTNLNNLTANSASQLKEIGTEAFYNCPIANSNSYLDLSRAQIKQIGARAFYGIKAKEIRIGSNYSVIMTDILEQAFANNSNLKSIYLTGYINSIHSTAFSNCTNVTDLTFDVDYYVNTTPYSYTSSPFSAMKKVTKLNINNKGRLDIGDYLFSGMTGLQEVNIVASLVAATAFKGCTGIKKVNWSVSDNSDFSLTQNPFNDSKLESIGISGDGSGRVQGYLCANQTSLTSITLSGIKTIGKYAFYQSGLTSVSLPADCKIIEEYAFAKSKLTKINLGNITSMEQFAFTSTSLTTVDLSSLTIVPNNAFYESTSLNKVTLGQKITTINASAFARCTALNSVTLPASITTIGNSAFSVCALKEITFPSKLRTIGQYAFSDISSLKTVSVLGKPIPTIDEATFLRSGVTKILASCNNVSELKANTNWVNVVGSANNIVVNDNAYTDWKSILSYDDIFNKHTKVDVEQEPGCDGIIILKATPDNGCTFIGWSDGDTSNPRTIELGNWDGVGTFYAISASAADYTTLNVKVNPSNTGAKITITDEQGNVHSDGKFYVDQSGNGGEDVIAIITPSFNTAQYKFNHWEYDNANSSAVNENSKTHALTVSMHYEDGEIPMAKFPTNFTLYLDELVKVTATTNIYVAGAAGVVELGDGAWEIWAYPNFGYEFLGWDDDGDGVVDNTEANRIVSPSQSTRYTAIFGVESPKSFNVHVITRGSGTADITRIDSNTSLTDIPLGETISLFAELGENTIVKGWYTVYDELISTENPFVFTAGDDDWHVVGEYTFVLEIEWLDPSQNSFMLMIENVSGPGTGEILSSVPVENEGPISTGYAPQRSDIIFTAVPNSGFEFDYWMYVITPNQEEPIVSYENPLTIHVPEYTEYAMIKVDAYFRQTTGIDEVPTGQVPSTKELRNGVLIIRVGDKEYNAQGQRVR